MKIDTKLYKITAYHCPACGGSTKPGKKYCDWCERDLGIRQNGSGVKARFLIDCGNYIYFDNIYGFDFEEKFADIDSFYRDLNGILHRDFLRPSTKIFTIDFPMTKRSVELLNKDFYMEKNTRIEVISPAREMAFESLSYISMADVIYSQNNIVMCKLQLVSDGKTEEYDTAIPQKIISEMRCPNCGAPIKSRFGACDYCSGWSEVEW